MGVEWEQGTPECAKLIEFLNKDMLKSGKKQIRLDSGVGIKPISITGTKRLVRMAIQHALDNKLKSVTLVHKGNIQKFTEGAFRQWGYDLAPPSSATKSSPSARAGSSTTKTRIPISPSRKMLNSSSPAWNSRHPNFARPWKRSKASPRFHLRTHGKGAWKKKLMINDRIADSIFQQVVTRADEYSVLATPNLNGDYISDACAAQVGGLGIAPGANVGDGYAIFEATHGTAPKYADKDVINPGS